MMGVHAGLTIEGLYHEGNMKKTEKPVSGARKEGGLLLIYEQNSASSRRSGHICFGFTDLGSIILLILYRYSKQFNA